MLELVFRMPSSRYLSKNSEGLVTKTLRLTSIKRFMNLARSSIATTEGIGSK